MRTEKPRSKTASSWRSEVDQLLDEFVNPPGTWSPADSEAQPRDGDAPGGSLTVRVRRKIEASRALILRLKYERGKRLLKPRD